MNIYTGKKIFMSTKKVFMMDKILLQSLYKIAET